MSKPTEPSTPTPDQMQFLANLAALPLEEAQRDALLLDMHGRVSRIEAKVETLPDHEDRIRKLEKRVWSLPASLGAAVMAAFGIHYGT